MINRPHAPVSCINLPDASGVSGGDHLGQRADLRARRTDDLPCVPGDELDLSALFANDDLGEGVVTIGDERLRSAYLAGSLTIHAGTVRIPDRDRLTLSLSAPFTIEDGELEIYANDFARFSRDAEYLWARGPIAGSGTATILLKRLDLPDQIAYVVGRIRYALD